MRRIVMVGVLIAALPIAATAIGRLGADCAARAQFARLAPQVRAANVTADPWRHTARIEGLEVRRGEFRMKIGRLTLPFAVPDLFAAYGQGDAPGTISAENIAVDIGPMHFAIQSITLTGTRLSNPDLISLFDSKNPLSIADRLKKLSAAHVAIPQIAMQETLAGKTENDVYRDVSLDELVNGRAANVRIGALESTISTPQAGSIEATYAPIAARGADLAAAIEILVEPRQADSQPLISLDDELRIDSGKILFAKAQLEIDIGALSAKGIKGRPLGSPQAAAPPPNSDPAADVYSAAVFNNFAVGSLDVNGVRIVVTDKDAAGTGTVGSVHLSQMADAKVADADFANLAVTAGGSSLKIAGADFHDMDLVALRGWAASDSGHAFPTAAIAREIHLTGVDVDAGDAKSRTRFQLGDAAIVSGDPADGISTRFSSSFAHFTFDPKDAGGELDSVAALGYDKIDLSSRIEAHFDAVKRELGVDDLSLSGADMGAVTIACKFANVSKDLFSADRTQMEAAALSMLMQRIEIRVENGGFFERLVTAAAKQSGKSPERVRQTYVAAAAIGIPALLGDSQQARTIGAAVAKFIAAPKSLRIVATAPQGLGAADFLLLKDPSALMSKLSVEAAADE